MSDPNLRGIMVDDLRTGRRPIGSVVEAETVNGVTSLVASGQEYPLNKLTIVEVGLSALSAGLITGATVPFNTIIRDGGTLTTANNTPTKVYFPSTTKKIRISVYGQYSYIDATPTGTYRGFVPSINVEGTAISALQGRGITSGVIVPVLNYGSGTGGSEATVSHVTPLFDFEAHGITPDPLNDNYVSLTVLHDCTDTVAGVANACTLKITTRLVVEIWE